MKTPKPEVFLAAAAHSAYWQGYDRGLIDGKAGGFERTAEIIEQLLKEVKELRREIDRLQAQLREIHALKS